MPEAEAFMLRGAETIHLRRRIKQDGCERS